MLIEQIQKQKNDARKVRDTALVNVLTVLEGEAVTIGKNDGNRLPTDDEVLKLIQKFIKNLNETISLLPAEDHRLISALYEKDVLQSFLPKQKTLEEISLIVFTLKENGMTNKGEIMKYLKSNYANQYDPKQVSELI